MKGRNLLGNLSVGGRIILKWILRAGYKNVDWIHLPQKGTEMSYSIFL
jgi:hypothetical protein